MTRIRRGVAPQFAAPVTAPKAALSDQVREQPPETAVPRPAIPFTQPKPQGVSLELATVEDFDTLWDWVRSDREGTTAFLGASYPNSQAFFNRLGNILGDEQNGTAWFRSVRDGDELIGFVMLNPIVKTPQLAATLHLYFKRDVKSSVFTPVIEALPDVTLMMVAPTDEFASAFVALDFEAKTVLTRPSGVQRDRI